MHAPRSPRVVLAADRMYSGGKEGVVMLLAAELVRMGCRTTIVCIRRGGPFASIAADAGVEVIELGSDRRLDLWTQARLMRLLIRLRPDVINVHDLSSLPYVALANRMTQRAPIVFTCHGLLGRRRLRLRELLAFGQVRAVTAVSRQTADRYAELLPRRFEPVVIRNGVWPCRRDAATAARLRTELGIAPGEFVFLAAGNIKPEKGYEDLLDACRLLRESSAPGPARSFRVLVAGHPMNPEYWQRLQSQQKRDSLESAVTFLGLRHDVWDLYSLADAFVLPSRSEGLPMALLEAMSAGVPAVATAVGGVPDVVTEGAGLLVEPARPDQFADAMGRLLAEPALCDSLAAHAARHVTNRFSAAEMAGHYLRLFRETMAPRAVPSTRTVAPSRVLPWGCSEPRHPQTSTSEGATKAAASSIPRVLMLGPRRPLVGGMVTVVENLCRSNLARDCDLSVLQTGKTTPQGRSLPTAIVAQSMLLLELVAQIVLRRPRIVHIHTCSGGTFWRDCVHLAAARLLGCRVIWHIHGGHFAEFVRRSGPLRRRVVRQALASASAAIVLGERNRQRLCDLAPAGRWHVVTNGVPVPEHAARPALGNVFLSSWATWAPKRACSTWCRRPPWPPAKASTAAWNSPARRSRADRNATSAGGSPIWGCKIA